jgi:hypothetical protein
MIDNRWHAGRLALLLSSVKQPARDTKHCCLLVDIQTVAVQSHEPGRIVLVYRKTIIIVHGNITPYEYQKHSMPNLLKLPSKSLSDFFDGLLIRVSRSYNIHCNHLWQTHISRQENIAKGTRSKFDPFTVVVLFDASLDVLKGKFHMFS